MEHDEFGQKYVDVLRQKPFALFPLPDLQRAPLDVQQGWQTRKFEYVEHNKAYVVIRDSANNQHFNIALALIEFALPGTLRLFRPLIRSNGDLL
jgi:hypothetical protein